MGYNKYNGILYPIETIDSLQVDYPLIEVLSDINTYKVSIKGVNATASEIELLTSESAIDISVHESLTAEFSTGILQIGDTIRQNDVRGVITKIISRKTTKKMIAGVLDTYVINTFLVDDIFGGLFNITNTEIQKLYNILPVYDDDGNILSYTSRVIGTIPTHTNEYVESTDKFGVTYKYKILDSNMDEHRGITKYIDLYLPVRRNFSYDRDKLLITGDKLPLNFNIDNLKLTREQWVTTMRERGMYEFDNSNILNIINSEILEVESLIDNNHIYDVNFNDIEYQLSSKDYIIYLKSLIPNGSISLGISESERIAPFERGGIEIDESDFYNTDTRVVQLPTGGSYARGK